MFGNPTTLLPLVWIPGRLLWQPDQHFKEVEAHASSQNCPLTRHGRRLVICWTSILTAARRRQRRREGALGERRRRRSAQQVTD